MDARTSLIFQFLTGISFLGNFGQKNQNGQFKLKLGTSTNSNMQNTMVLFTFSVLELIPFLSKNQNCQFKLKLVT